MIKFPYGIDDFKKIITQDYFYSDRTSAIPYLEQSDFQLFIRPRRFGKSLLLSMLENYYDIARKKEFDDLFGHLAIGNNPTALKNSYFVLCLDFSCVDPSGQPEDIKRSLYNHINACIVNFIRYYSNNGYNFNEFEINFDDAIFSLKTLTGFAQSFGIPIYLLIDEYDNFANTVMMQSEKGSHQRYNAIVHEEGPLKTLFKAIKSSTGGTMLDRVFITGVSPVVMSDITSGYNIARDVFFSPELADLCGFREEEIKKILSDIAESCKLESHRTDEALDMMRSYYNGYNFVPRTSRADSQENILVYNPTMCLYFFDEFQRYCEFPQEMLDANLAVDEGKLRYIAELAAGSDIILFLTGKNSSITIQRLNKRFSLEDMLSDSTKDKKFLTSFLYFFGVLTLAGSNEQGELILKVPNLVIHSLYIERAGRILIPEPTVRDTGQDAAKQVYQQGNIAPLCDFVEANLFKIFSNRDYIQANELTFKALFLSLLYNDILYIMDSEPEIERGYADLTMIIRPDRRFLKIFDALIEFKFLSLQNLNLSGSELACIPKEELYHLPAVKNALQDGRKQALRYGKNLEEKYKRLNLKKFVVVSLGFERLCFVNDDQFEN